MRRSTPLDLVFSHASESAFPRIAASMAAAGHDPSDRDAFLMDREVITLLHDLRPDEGLGEAMDQMVALVHHVYVTWAAGAVTIPIDRDAAEELLEQAPADGAYGKDVPPYFAQLPERLIWATVVENGPPEPLDGIFVSPAPGGDLRVLGIFGVRPDRSGFSVVEATGGRIESLAREDGTRPFDPMLAGGASAGLRSIAGEEELLELGWRTQALAAGAESGDARWKP